MDDESSHDALDSPAFVGNPDVAGDFRVKFGWVYNYIMFIFNVLYHKVI